MFFKSSLHLLLLTDPEYRLLFLLLFPKSNAFIISVLKEIIHFLFELPVLSISTWNKVKNNKDLCYSQHVNSWLLLLWVRWIPVFGRYLWISSLHGCTNKDLGFVLFFLHRCKLFYKKDNEFKEKGVGTLHLKPAGNEKTQLLVRADTNLGKYVSPSNKSWCQNSLLSIRIFLSFLHSINRHN